jgi:hypothetical protein
MPRSWDLTVKYDLEKAIKEVLIQTISKLWFEDKIISMQCDYGWNLYKELRVVSAVTVENSLLKYWYVPGIMCSVSLSSLS